MNFGTFLYAETKVDIELVLAADISDSMSNELGTLQRRGYAAALRSPEIAMALSAGAHQRIALTYLEWGDTGQAAIIVPWTLVSSPQDAIDFADLLMSRRQGRLARTSISHALGFANSMFDGNGFEGERRVIDISGNGPNNQGVAVTAARDAVVASGTIINGLPIMVEMDLPRGTFWNGFDLRELDAYYTECVIGGPGSFVLPVREARDFHRTLKAKLFLEISGLAPPARARLHRAAFEC